MKELIRQVLDSLIVDFEGELNRDVIIDFLREDDSPAALALRTKLTNNRAVSQFLMTVADELTNHIKSGITPTVIREEMERYVEEDTL